MKVEGDNCLRHAGKLKLMITGLLSKAVISTFYTRLVKAKKKGGKFKLQYIQYTERIIKESDQSVYH